MIKDNSNYLYLIVPNEYRCVYYHILDTLGTLGEDLLSVCTATCKGKAVTAIGCYNMFNAACAAYANGLPKLARTLISYIKAQLDISCNKNITFENSSNDEFVYLTVPIKYECVYNKLLDKLVSWGQDLLNDCTSNCKGNNKNILNCWNLLKSVIAAYEHNNEAKADRIADYINVVLQCNCGSFITIDEPELTNLVLSTEYNSDNNILTILGGTVNIENKNNIIDSKMSLINLSNGQVIASDIEANDSFVLNTTINIPFSTTVDFQLKVESVNGTVCLSNIYSVTTPSSGEEPDVPYVRPTINNFVLNYEKNEDTLVISIISATFNVTNAENLQYRSLKLVDFRRGNVIADALDINGDVYIGVPYSVPNGGNTEFRLQATDVRDNLIQSSSVIVEMEEHHPFDAPVLTIEELANNTTNHVIINSLNARCTNPQNFNGSLTLKYTLDGVEHTVAENIIPAANMTIQLPNSIEFDVPVGGKAITFVLGGRGTDSNTYSTNYTKTYIYINDYCVYTGLIHELPQQGETEENLIDLGLVKQSIPDETEVEFNTAPGEDNYLVIIIPLEYDLIQCENNSFSGDYIENSLEQNIIIIDDITFNIYYYYSVYPSDNTYKVTIRK